MIRVYENAKQLDLAIINDYLVSEEILIEHAASALADEISKRFMQKKVVIVCGSGNNGADGLVLARILHSQDFDVSIFLASQNEAKELETLKKIGIDFIASLDNASCDVLVDCLFGSGLNRDLEEDSKKIIIAMNEIEAFKVACDVPSGIQRNGDFELCFCANLTVTMGVHKLALFSDKAKDFVGEIVLANLGVNRKLYEQESPYYLLEKSDLHLPFRTKQNLHKGDFGHLSLVMGDTSGSCILAGIAAMRFGAGLVSVVQKEKISIPPMLIACKKPSETSKVLVVGMGLGKAYIKDEILSMLEGRSSVIDADMFHWQPLVDLLNSGANLVLTPHPKEFANLLNMLGHHIDTQSVQKKRFSLAKEFSTKFPQTVLVLKGANTLIAHSGQIYINPFGTNSLSKGGSGDVLAGLIGACLAQKYEPLQACITGTLALGFASRAYKDNNYSLCPQDLIDALTSLDPKDL